MNFLDIIIELLFCNEVDFVLLYKLMCRNVHEKPFPEWINIVKKVSCLIFISLYPFFILKLGYLTN